MKLINHIKESFSNILVSKMRSLLTLLGILIGTGSVVALVSSGELATQHALAQFKTLGTDLLAMSISPSTAQPSATTGQPARLTLSQVDQLVASSPNIDNAAPYTNYFANINYGATQLQGTILGVTQNLQDIVKIEVDQGRFISFLDNQEFYCVIGNAFAQKIQQTGETNIIGKQLLVGKYYYTVIGTLQPWQQNMFMYADIDNSLLIPIQNSFLLSKYVQIQSIVFKLKPNSDVNATQQSVTDAFNNIMPNQQLYFHSPRELIASMEKQRQTLTLLLSLIGGISLLVGGIGVMNIMLVSVVERRREIGLRMAVGAKQRDIQWMFLTEAVTLTLTGGFLGILVGVMISFIASKLSGWEFQILFEPIIVGFLVSALVGIFFGFYPAYQASRLDPIKTLRSD